MKKMFLFLVFLLLPGILLSGQEYTDFFVYSTNTTNIKDRLHIEYGSAGANGYVEIGCDTVVDGSLVSGGDGSLRERAVINGDARVSGVLRRQNNTVVAGEIEENAWFPEILLPQKEVYCGVDSLYVRSGESLTPEAGDYGGIKLEDRTVLNLSSGVYNFREFDGGTDLTINITLVDNQPVEINVRDRMRLGDRTKIEFTGKFNPFLVRIYSNQTDQFRVGPDSKMTAVILVPKGDITVFSRNYLHGGLYARNVTIEPEVICIGNRFPVAKDDFFETLEDTLLNVPPPGILANDYDPDGAVLFVELTQLPLHGDLVVNDDGSFVYFPMKDYNGEDFFRYTVSDGIFSSEEVTAYITVISVNDPPAALEDFFSTNEDTPFSVPLPGVLGNDYDIETPVLSSELVVPASNGELSFRADGSFDYIPEENFFGADYFVYRAFDGELYSEEVPVTIEVIPVNDPPVAEDLHFSINRNESLSIMLQGSDPDSSSLSFDVFSDDLNGALSGKAPGLIYTPGSDFVGTDSFSYRVYDGGLYSGTAVVTIDIVNQAPVITSDPVTEFIPEKTEKPAELVDLSLWEVLQYGSPQSNASWVISNDNTEVEQVINAAPSIFLSDFTLFDDAITGTWLVDTTGDDDFMGFVFGYQDRDHFYLFDWKQGNQSAYGYAAAGMSVKIVSADSAVTYNDLWPSAGNGDRVKVVYHNTIPWKDRVPYDFNLEFHPGYFTITVKEEESVLDVIRIEDDTYATGKFGFYNFSQSNIVYKGFTKEVLSESYRYDVDAQDPDDDELTYRLIEGPADMTINPDTGFISWMPEKEDAGFHDIAVEVFDGFGGSAIQRYQLNVIYNNEPPQIVSLPVVEGRRGQTYEYPVKAIDPENDTLTYVLTESPHGMIIDPQTGVISWEPGEGDMGDHPVIVEVYDVFEEKDFQSFTIALAPPLEPPVVSISSPVDGSLFTHEELVRITAEAFDSDGSVTQVNFYDGDILLFEDREGPYEFFWENPSIGSHSITAEAVDNDGLKGVSVPVEIEVVIPPPSLALWADPVEILPGETAVISWETQNAVNCVVDHGVGEIDLAGTYPVILTESRTFTFTVTGRNGEVITDSVTINVVDYDVAVSGIDLSGTSFDSENMNLTGTLVFTLSNLGSTAVERDFDISVYAKDHENDTLNILGEEIHFGILEAGDSKEVMIPINGRLYYSGSPVYVLADSRNVLPESDETNNISSNTKECQMMAVEPGSFEPVLEWEWSGGSSTASSHYQVMAAPIVASLTDDNGDGLIDENDIPDIIFNTFAGSGYRSSGVLRAISGDGSGEIFAITDYYTAPGCSPAAADIDNDGYVEICTFQSGGSRILAFNHDGSFLWQSDSGITSMPHSSAISIADLDSDSNPEVIYSNTVFNGHDGSLKWSGASGGSTIIGCTADLDLQGGQEVIAGNRVYHSDGTLYWQNLSIPDGGYSGVANFDEDPYPEIVIVSSYVYLLEHTGELIWQTAIPGGGHGGAPTIADYDSDGQPEIGVAGASYYTVFETDGTVKWLSSTQDGSSRITGSTVFDFEGDGSAEVVYADEVYLRIYKGTDGTVLFREPIGSGTLIEYPLVVDVDNDNNAEIVVPGNNYYRGPKTGIQVFGDANDSWVNTRKIWNQHSYHVTNIEDNGKVPAVETHSWLEFNSYRQNHIANALACEDYTASWLKADYSDYPASVDITVRIGNAGVLTLRETLNAAFYFNAPEGEKQLLEVKEIDRQIPEGSFIDVFFTWHNPPEGVYTVTVAVDDDGTGNGRIRELDEANNIVRGAYMFGNSPVADAGGDQTAIIGSDILLDGSGSYDSGNNPILYNWFIAGKPAGSSTGLINADTAWPLLIPDKVGEYVIGLSVNNGTVSSGVDTMRLFVHEPGIPPVALITEPLPDFSFETGRDIPVLVEASDDDGTVVRVELFDGDKSIGIDEAPPWQFSWKTFVPGEHYLRAAAIDNQGNPGYSEAVSVSVYDNTPPVVDLTISPERIFVGDSAHFTIDIIEVTELQSVSLTVNGIPVQLENNQGSFLCETEGLYTAECIAEDAAGNRGGVITKFYVYPVGSDAPPVAEAGEDKTIIIGDTVNLDGGGSYDSEGLPLAYTWYISSQPSVSLAELVNSDTASPSFTPDVTGTYRLNLYVFNGTLYSEQDSVVITVNDPPNMPPVVSLESPLPGDFFPALKSVLLRAAASDTDGVVVQVDFFANGEKVGEAFMAPYMTGWIPANEGEYQITSVAYDDDGASTESPAVSVTVTEAPVSHQRPYVTLTASSSAVYVDQNILLSVNASAPQGVASTRLVADGQELALDVNGQAFFSSSVPGVFKAEAFAYDAAGNSGYDSLELTILTAVSSAAPTALISGPAELTELKLPTEITGTVDDDNLLYYTLEYSMKDENLYSEFARGTTTVIGGGLGTFDTTLLKNGLYDIRLTAVDQNGQQMVDETVYLVSGGMKVGIFSLSFTDLSIPVAGIPINITRTYDTRDRMREGDFGYGWTMGVDTIKIQESCTPGEHWEQYKTGGGILNPATFYLRETKKHIVTLTYANGMVEKFQMKLTPDENPWATIDEVNVSYTPMAGTYSKLEALDQGTQTVFGAEGPVWLGDQDGNEYNPDRYMLTTVDGTKIIIHQDAGIEKIIDRNENSLDFTEEGIIHSAGKSVLYTRDGENRIVGVSDPMGNGILYEYDSFGDLVRVTDREGNETSITYDESHYLVDIYNALGVRAVRNEYDESGRLTASIDPDGNRIELTHNIDERLEITRDKLGNDSYIYYNDDGNVVKSVNVLGHITLYAYDDNGYPRSITDPLNNTTYFEYDSKGNLLKKTDAQGNVSTTDYTFYPGGSFEKIISTDAAGRKTIYDYDSKGNVSAITANDGNVTTLEYDNSGKVNKAFDQTGREVSNTFDTHGNLTSSTDSDGRSFTFGYNLNGLEIKTGGQITTTAGLETGLVEKKYDKNGRIIELIDADGLSTFYEYDGVGRQTVKTDKLGNRITSEYNNLGMVVKRTAPGEQQVVNSYDAAGRLIEVMGRDGKKITHTYDKLGRPIRTTDSKGFFIEKSYDPLNRIISASSSDGFTEETDFDEMGRIASRKDPLGRITEYEYYSDGKKKLERDYNGNESLYYYDDMGRLARVEYSDGSSKEFGFTGKGQVASEKDRDGIWNYYTWNSAGLLESVENGLGNITGYSYNELGNLISQTDANDHLTSYLYNRTGKNVGKSYPLGSSSVIDYDLAANRVDYTDFNSNKVSAHYDSQGRLIKKSFPDNTSLDYDYSADGALLSVTDSHGTTSYNYNNDGLVSRISGPEGSIDYEYNLNGKKSAIITSSGRTSYRYDNWGRIQEVEGPDGGVSAYSYDAKGRLEGVEYPNGTLSQYEFDDFDRLIFQEDRKKDGEVLSSYRYTLSPAGRRLKVVENTGRQVEFSYDDAGRLIEETITGADGGSRLIRYTYDNVGNRFSKSDNGEETFYSYDANDRLIQDSSYKYEYDNNGNLTAKIGDNEEFYFTYNYLDQLIFSDITKDGQVKRTEYIYDFNGLRVGMRVDGGETVRYLFDQTMKYPQVIEEKSDDGAVISSYLYGNKLISRSDGAETFYYHHDGGGSTRLVTDHNAVQAGSFCYDAFGSQLEGEGEHNYLYRGEFYDAETDLYYLRARYYQPGTGRFVSTDPAPGVMNNPVTRHRYLYANNDPVNYLDPTGKFSLMENAITVGIIGNVAGIFLSQGPFRSIYSKLGQYILPDAFLFGGTVGVEGSLVKDVAIAAGLSHVFVGVGGNGSISGSVEIDLSITSGELGAFLVRPALSPLTSNPGIGTHEPGNSRPELAASIYRGGLYNVWNLGEYSGNCFSTNIGEFSIFWGDNQLRGGPWGMTQSRALDTQKPGFDMSDYQLSLGAGHTVYEEIDILKSDSEVWIATLAGTASVIMDIVMNLDAESIKNISLTREVANFTLWFQTGLAKMNWNKETGYTPRYRQEHSRPGDYFSGPQGGAMSY